MLKFDDFIRLYPLVKTLRFELRPVGKTAENIKKSGLLEQDQHRANSYFKVKRLLDECHKAFIEDRLRTVSLLAKSDDTITLIDYLEAYQRKNGNDAADKKYFEDIVVALRRQISKCFECDYLDSLFSRFLFDSKKNEDAILVKFVNQASPAQLVGMDKQEALSLVREFKGFTTYFSEYHENRKIMYSKDEKSTAIAYRLINENLPRFVDNLLAFKKIAEEPDMKECLDEVFAHFKDCLKVDSLGDVFQIEYYDEVLTQRQIDVYNAVIGGKTENNAKVKIKGVNEYVNQYNQHHKNTKLPKLRLLFKQILSERSTMSWMPEAFEKDQEVLNAIRDNYALLSENVLGDSMLKSLLSSLRDYNTDGIYLRNDRQLTDISQKMFGSWNFIQRAIVQDIKNTSPLRKRKESEEDYEERMVKLFNSASSYSIGYIDDCLNRVDNALVHAIEGYFATLGAVNTTYLQCDSIFDRIDCAYSEISALINSEYPANQNLAQDKDSVEKIKEFLDNIKRLQFFVRPLLGKGDENGKDERFYGEFSSLWEELDSITLLYNKVRNYLTRKPYSLKKIKLNFENAQLLKGWDANKETTNASVILRRDGMYFLAIMRKEYAKLLGKSMPADGECYEKMVYKLLPGANKMLPKVFFAKSRLADFCPSKQILENYKKGTHKKGKSFSIDDCRALIDFFKESIDKHESWSKFGFVFSETSAYQDLNDFYQEVEQQGYRLSFADVSASFIDKLVEEGKMYLFQIYNKDFSKYSKGVPNLHTMYWKALFDERNLTRVVYKLNGEAELFYREKSLECHHATHPASFPILNKNKENEKKESIFKYDLIKDRRYTEDKYMFHVPVTLNFKCLESDDINLKVREYLKSAKDTHIIGIDRGERHLLYLVVIDMHGNIKEQFTLNEIVNEYKDTTYRTNYHELLDIREKERLKARQSWQMIERIKELKEGYLSQVVHKISQLMIKYHAVVVLEDLSIGFMRGRQKVEKQVYQKFEKMLIEKLNYLVDKRANEDQVGGLLKAYQLTGKFEGFKKLRKQSGFLFYVPAWNTSKMDPLTGFVNLLDTRYQNVEMAKIFFSKFKSICFNPKKNWFEFAFDYNDFGRNMDGARTIWTLCTQGNRIKSFRNPEKSSQWDSQEINLTNEFKILFNDYHIDVNSNLKERILSQTEKSFFTELLHLLKLTLQMRNSLSGTEVDYLISPVADDNGVFFDSRSCDETLPKNADANGAYNIARKGLMLVRQIKEANDLSSMKFDLSNNSWLIFAQQKKYEHD